MTAREAAYQRFSFKGKITHDHREALTSSEKKVFELHRAGHTKQSMGKKLNLTPVMVFQHLRVVKAKGWI